MAEIRIKCYRIKKPEYETICNIPCLPVDGWYLIPQLDDLVQRVPVEICHSPNSPCPGIYSPNPPCPGIYIVLTLHVQVYI